MRPVLVPRSDVNSDTAVLTAWHRPDRSPVARGEAVAEVETSKAILDIVAPEDGFLLHGRPGGADLRLSDPIAWIFADLEALEAHAASLGNGGAPAPAGAGPRASAPAVRRAAQLGVDLGALRMPGLITVKAVEAAAARDRPRRADLPDPLPARAGAQRMVIIGAGLGATQVLDILAARDGAEQAVAIVDDDAERWGQEVDGVPVVGGWERVPELVAAHAVDAAVVSISTSVPARTRLRQACEAAGVPLANAIDPTARIGRGAHLGSGNVLCAFCHVGVEARIGDNNFLSAYNSYDHHNVLGSDISTGPGCQSSALVTLGDRVRLGTGIFIEPHVELGAGVQVASGAVIVASVPAGHAVKTRVVTTVTVPLQRDRTQ